MAVMQEVCRDLEEAYLPAFQACVQQGGAGSVMCSYNAVNGTPACANSHLLQKVMPLGARIVLMSAAPTGTADTCCPGYDTRSQA